MTDIKQTARGTLFSAVAVASQLLIETKSQYTKYRHAVGFGEGQSKARCGVERSGTQ